MFNFVSKRYWYFLLSALIIVPGIIALIAVGLNLGIEFKSGSTMTLVFREPVPQAMLRQAFDTLGHSEVIIQHSSKNALLIEGEVLSEEEEEELTQALHSEFGLIRVAHFESESKTMALISDQPLPEVRVSQELEAQGHGAARIESTLIGSFLIRTQTLATEEWDEEGNIVVPSEEEQIEQALAEEFGAFDSLDVYSISPVIAFERTRYTLYAVAAAMVGILLYIAWAFRRLPNPFRYGVCAIVALVHDALVVAGLFSLLHIEVDAMFVIGLLTVIGYSVNNVIVVFDRIRENLARGPGSDLETTINSSLTQTLPRCLNTSLTTLIVLVALFLFGGMTIRPFILVLIIGITVGTYTSIFIASSLLIVWENNEVGRLLRRVPLPGVLARGRG